MARRMEAPEGWKISLLDSVTKRGSGHTPDKEHPEYWNGGIKWVSLADSHRLDAGTISETDKETSELGIAKSSAVVHPSGTVILSRDAGVGKSAVLDGDMAVSQHFIAWRCSPSLGLQNWFLYSWLQFNKREFERQAVGSTIKTIGLPYFKRLQICYPPYAEQSAIVEIIRTWDRAIETVEALIANARAQRQALMQQLLSGKHRLPGFSGEWQRKPINEIATRVTRRNDGTELPVLTISSTSGFVRQDEKYSRYMAGKSVETYIMLNEGEFAYNKGNSKTYEFGCIFDLEGYERALVPHVYVCFKLRKGYSHRFYKALFEADYLAPQLGRLVNTGVRNNGLLNIKPSEFLGTRVPVPPIDEQDAIAAVMEAASRTVIEYETQLAALRQEKAALMQQLLTGKRRVKLPESEVA
ncbi:MAG: type I restriction endonuclease subunit R [Croceicoccus sp.]|nr:type I restriction endonuclease subunit R [Croceicoccus sp.]MAL26364.1 type I restriction endonuclease subunit R [Croceicoccus sp.]|tara:strand:+ start:19195 stop:20430 length:1236 start_codon:yes stop_codon:yes gene_type:complete